MMHKIRTKDGMATVDLTPGKAIRLHCKACFGWEGDVRECDGLGNYPGGTCGLFPYRLGKGRPKVAEIQRYCLWCQSGKTAKTQETLKQVRECEDMLCCLWPYRQGHNPAKKGQGASAAQMRAMTIARNLSDASCVKV